MIHSHTAMPHVLRMLPVIATAATLALCGMSSTVHAAPPTRVVLNQDRDTAGLAQIGAGAGPVSIFAWDPGAKFAVSSELTEAPNTGSRFGFAVAMNDTYAVIGAPDVTLIDIRQPLTRFTNGAGAAFVFKRAAGTDTWTFLVRLIAPARSLSQTGCAVAIDSVTNDIVVGAWASDAAAPFGGAAFVYSKGRGDDWGEPALAAAYGAQTRIPTQVIAPDDLLAIDQFGFSVAIDDGTIAIGCPLSGTSNTGAIYVFEYDAKSEYVFTQKLLDEASGANDQTGTKLALHGDLLIAGAQNDDVQGRINAGSALVFARSKGIWTATSRVYAPTPSVGAYFGSAVAVVDGDDADWLLVGSPTQASGRTTPIAGNGAAFMFRSTDAGDNWTLDGSLLPRSDNINNNFGYSVALSQTEPPQAIVGAPGFDTAVPSFDDPTVLRQVVNAGSSFAYVRTGAAAWAIRGVAPLTGDLWSPAILANSNLGRAVAVAPSRPDFCIASSELPSSLRGSAYSFRYVSAEIGIGDNQVPGPAAGPLDANGNPSNGETPGTGGGGTGGGTSGGGAPAGGITSGPGAITLPLLPIIKNWGVVKGSAVALNGNSVSILQTDGKHTGHNPSFTRMGKLPAGARYAGCGDMNGDMSGDVLFVDDREVLRYWKRDAKKILEVMTIDTLPVGFDAIKVADFDNNNKDDVLLRGILDPSLLIIWNIEGGAIASTLEYTLPEGDWDVFTGNFRTKTTPDILIRDRESGEVRVLVPGAAGEADYPIIATRGNRNRIAGFGDIDGNGQPDIFWQGANDDVDLMDQDEAGNYIRIARRRTGLASGHIVNIRDWNDDGTIDFWIRRGERNFIQYGVFTNGFVYGIGSCDLGNASGKVVDIADR